MDTQKNIPSKPTNHQVSLDGIEAVISELRKLGLDPEVSGGRKKFVRVSSTDNSRTISIKVKTIRDDWNWQTDIGEAEDEQQSNENRFWIFVNLKRYSAPVQFWIVPDFWLRNDIKAAHQEYLDRHNGHRAQNDTSTHHSINEARISEWKDKWDILDILPK